MGLNNGQELNYESLASDSGVPARTIEGHIEILKDTLIAFELLPFSKTKKRKDISRSKFYFFDPGVANFLAQKLPLTEGSSDLGISFEHFIINEVRAFISYKRKLSRLTYWRSREKEVDLIIGQTIALEIKLSKSFKPTFTQNLLALREENIIKSYIVIGRFEHSGLHEGIQYMNYKEFLTQLWADKFDIK